MDDPGSLQNLNDIVVPGAVAAWPPAPGWYAVGALLAVLVLWAAFRFLRYRQQNTYRRQALRELAEIRTGGSAAAGGIPMLLKRTALSAWPRAEVARLSGAEWHRFLDRTAPGSLFEGETGRLLDRLSYGSGRDGAPVDGDFQRICRAAEHWLKTHRAGAP